MTMFWIITAALALLSPLFVVLPLLKSRTRGVAAGDEPMLAVYRDQLAELDADRRSGRLGEDDYAQARGELENRLLQEVPEAAAPAPAARPDRPAAFAAMLVVPLLAVALYLAIGNPGALRPQASDVAHGLGQQQMDALIARLATRLDRNPMDAKGWAMLGRAQAVLERFDEASSAYGNAVALLPDDAQLLADYADALGMAQGRRLAGEPEALIERALRADPANAKALSLAGTAAFQKKDFAQAVQHWERLRHSVPPESEFADAVQRNIDEARSLALAGSAVRPASDAPRAPAAPVRR